MNIVRGWAYGLIAGGVIGVVVFLSHQNWFFLGVCLIVIAISAAILYEMSRWHHHG